MFKIYDNGPVHDLDGVFTLVKYHSCFVDC